MRAATESNSFTFSNGFHVFLHASVEACAVARLCIIKMRSCLTVVLFIVLSFRPSKCALATASSSSVVQFPDSAKRFVQASEYSVLANSAPRGRRA